MGSIRCAFCGREVPANPRIRNQTHCNRKECRKDKKKLWQRQKMATDADYKANQRDCAKAWRNRNPDYWKQYRKNHPQAAEQNRLKQQARNAKRRRIAKMDTLCPLSEVSPGTYYLVPEEVRDRVIAKMDASVQKIALILMPYNAASLRSGGIAKEDSMDLLIS
jgi:hypothetical protein